MSIRPDSVWDNLQSIHRNSPLIHNITNYVVMEQTANALLAIGASPVMAHALDEVREMTGCASCLVLNIGTLSPLWIQAMLSALHEANNRNIPVVLDPVGAGATTYRSKTCKQLFDNGKIAVIRGNASEIAALSGHQSTIKGVDSALNSTEYTQQAKLLAKTHQCVVWMSGKIDVITDGLSVFEVRNGHPLMSKVTGMGCIASSITGAFLAVNNNRLQAAANAAVLMGITGELASLSSQGPGSFKSAFFDALFLIKEHHLNDKMCAEIL